MTEAMTLDALAPYSALRADLEKIKAANEGLVFDYTKPKGLKAAKSHIFTLRKVKGDIERCRKAAKAEALEYGRKVDSAAKELVAEVETMIDVHEAPIRAIEEREAARKATHEAKLATLAMPEELPEKSDAIKQVMDGIATTTIDESWEEYEAPARKLRDQTLEALAAKYQSALAREAEAAELEKLRKEQAAREQAEREAKIAAEAAEKAKREAEEAAKAEAARKEAEARAALEAERRKSEAAAAEAERVKREAAEAEAARKAEEDRKAAEDAKRAANKKHREKVLKEAADAMLAVLSHNPDELALMELANAIADGKIPHVTMKF